MSSIEPILLVSVSNQTEESMIVCFLEDADIPVWVKDSGSGGYMKIYMGYSIFGSDIYVASKDYKKAKELLDIYFNESNVENIVIEKTVVAEKDKDNNKSYSIKRQWVARLILFGMILSIIAAFILNNFFE